MKIEDELIERFRHLPEHRQAEVLRYIERVEAEASGGPGHRIRSERTAAAMRWLTEYRAEYTGRWVALDGCRLVASGNEAKSVYDQARAEGVIVPFVHQVESEDEGAFWAGWL